MKQKKTKECLVIKGPWAAEQSLSFQKKGWKSQQGLEEAFKKHHMTHQASLNSMASSQKVLNM